MSLLIKLKTADFRDGEGEVKFPPGDRVLEGAPQTTVWNQLSGLKGEMRVGVAESTPGTARTIKGETCEVVTLLEGVIELTEDGSETLTLKAGDIFIMKPGFVGTWKTVETVKKAFVILS